MPSKTDPNPRAGTVMTPRFLDGKAPAGANTDPERRQALADAVVSKENYWFAGAYVNRMWGELMGQSFYSRSMTWGRRRRPSSPPCWPALAGLVPRHRLRHEGAAADRRQHRDVPAADPPRRIDRRAPALRGRLPDAAAGRRPVGVAGRRARASRRPRRLPARPRRRHRSPGASAWRGRSRTSSTSTRRRRPTRSRAASRRRCC